MLRAHSPAPITGLVPVLGSRIRDGVQGEQAALLPVPCPLRDTSHLPATPMVGSPSIPPACMPYNRSRHQRTG